MVGVAASIFVVVYISIVLIIVIARVSRHEELIHDLAVNLCDCLLVLGNRDHVCRVEPAEDVATDFVDKRQHVIIYHWQHDQLVDISDELITLL